MIRPALAFAVFTAAACSSRSDSGRAVPWRTAFDSTGDTIVARTTGDVPNKLIRHLVLEQRIGEADGSDTLTFGQIAHIAVTKDNQIFVFDAQGPSLKLFDSSGTFVRFVGHKGGGPGEFEQVNGMNVVPNGSLVLWDASHGRMNVYSTTGDYSTQWSVPISGIFDWNGLHTDADGIIVLRTPLSRTGFFGEGGFLRFDSTGALIDTVRIPKWVDSTPLLTASSGNPPGLVQARPLPFAPQLAYAWSWAGSLLSGPSSRYEIHASKAGTKPLTVVRDVEAVPVLPGEADDERAWVTASLRRSFPNWSWSGPDIPAHKPAYAGFWTGYDGQIWVSVYSLGERLALPEPAWDAAPGAPPPPLRHYREPNVYDVFESNGTYVGRVRLERGQQIMRMRGNRVWGVLTDSLGVSYVARWRVEPSFQASK